MIPYLFHITVDLPHVHIHIIHAQSVHSTQIDQACITVMCA